MARRTRRRSRKSRRSRKRRGGSVVGALRTALLPFLLYKGQKAMQKRFPVEKRPVAAVNPAADVNYF